ncbi:MAG: tetratricopeptide repeat protein [Thermoguttaceae bacterium]|nr:tetratricopeptide repeat protein [Thermoguttaceae bacterium]
MASFIEGKRVFFYGEPASMTLRQTASFVRTQGATLVRSLDETVDLVVVCEARLQSREWLEMMNRCNEVTRQAFESGRFEILSESDFWQCFPGIPETRSKAVESKVSDEREAESCETGESPQYTPAMLAELLGQPIATIRLWFQRGLLLASRQTGKLPYFKTEELLVARRILDFQSMGISLDSIVKQVELWHDMRPGLKRVILNLVPSHDQTELLLRCEDGALLDPEGQGRMDFESAGQDIEKNIEKTPKTEVTKESVFQTDHSGQTADRAIVAQKDAEDTSKPPTETTGKFLDPVFFPTVPSVFDDLTAEEQQEFDKQIGKQVVLLCENAWHREEEGNWSEAIRLYRGALMAGGPDAGISFQLAELLEEQNEWAAARERYYTVLEMDENHLEARANLGRVLARLGEYEEAIAALEGTLQTHPGYVEARFELGKIYVKQKRYERARLELETCRRVVPEGVMSDEIENLLEQIRSS